MSNYITQAFIRGFKAAVSWFGLGATVILLAVQVIIRGFDVNIFELLYELLAAVVFVIAIFVVWELRASYAQIKLKPVIEPDYAHNQDTAYLIVESDEPTRIVLTAKLIKADYLSSMGNILYKHPQKLDALKWEFQNQECEMTISAFDKTSRISVAQYMNGIVFTYCRGKRESIGHGVVLVKIRVDGVRADGSNRSIWPRYFIGYLHANNVNDNNIVSIAKLKFREGHDWKNDKEIPLWIRSQKVQDD